MILILSDPCDPHTRQVVRRLREKGAEVARIDLQEVPRLSSLSAWIEDGKAARVELKRPDVTVDFDRVRSLWLRRVSRVSLDDSLQGSDADFARDEATAFAFSVGAMLADRFCVNPLVTALATDHGKGKLSQLEAARRVGMSVPRTLITNDPERARQFLETCEGGAIYKPMLPPTRNIAAVGSKEKWATIFTTKLDERARASLERVRLAPCMFQELVAKRFELRVTVMGNKVFATEIHSQVLEETSVDFRRVYALDRTPEGRRELPHAPHALPPEVEEECRALNRALGLVFGAFDFIVTPDGRYVFLEVNQQGQFLWLEQLTGQPLLENFCELLIQARMDFACDAPLHAPGPLPFSPPTDAYDVD